MVELPAQVQRQVDEVAEWDRQQAEILAAGDAPPANEPNAPPAPPVAAAPAAAPAAPAPEDASWEARYKTLQGMFNADVPRLNGQVKDLLTQVGTLQTQLTAAKTVPPAPPATTVTPADIEAYGGDLVDLMKRVSGDAVAQVNASWAEKTTKLEAELAEVKAKNGNVTERVAATDRAAYFTGLASLVPNYEAVNTDAGFMAWLGEVDPAWGMTRQTTLKDAFDKFDITRTAALFNTWIALGLLPAPPAADPAAAPAPEAPVAETAKQRLERQVSPNGSRDTPPTTKTDDATRVWTAAQVDEFYRAQGKGQFLGREAEAKAIEANIDLALSQGRISQ